MKKRRPRKTLEEKVVKRDLMVHNIYEDLTIYLSSILFLLVFHIIFLGLWYIGFVSRVAGKRPEILTILQNCAVSLEDDCLCT